METFISRPCTHQTDLQPAIDLVLRYRAVEQIDPWPPIHELRHRLSLGIQPGSENTQVWVEGFIGWYNTEHRHSGLGLLPPVVHQGQALAVSAERQQTGASRDDLRVIDLEEHAV